MDRESERARMKTAYGRESVGHPDETGIRSGSSANKSGQPDGEPKDSGPSRQTSTAKDMKGQM